MLELLLCVLTARYLATLFRGLVEPSFIASVPDQLAEGFGKKAA